MMSSKSKGKKRGSRSPHKDKYDKRSYWTKNAEFIQWYTQQSKNYYGSTPGTRGKKR